MPASNGRVLLTGRGAERQIPHMDFKVPDKGPAGSRYVVPSYFFIATGPRGAHDGERRAGRQDAVRATVGVTQARSGT